MVTDNHLDRTNRLIFGEGLISTLGKFTVFYTGTTVYVSLTPHLGKQHRKQRKMLNPVFSLANMRLLLPEVQPISDILLEQLRSQVPEDGSKGRILSQYVICMLTHIYRS